MFIISTALWLAAVADAGLRHRLPLADEDDLFTVFYPELCEQALFELGRMEIYDVLVVDEAQDLLLAAYLDVLDILLKGSLKEGRWLFFLDPYQDIFHGIGSAGLQRLEAAKPARSTLSVNCRNTMPIAVTTALLSGVHCRSTLLVDGPAVEADYWYRDDRHQQRLISNCLNRLLSGSIRASEIVVLSRRRRENGCLRNGLIGVPYPLIDIGDPSISPGNAIRYATISSFKGLEADVVLIADIDDLSQADAQLSIYVGASRAKALLALFFAETLRERYDELAVEYGRTLMVGRV